MTSKPSRIVLIKRLRSVSLITQWCLIAAFIIIARLSAHAHAHAQASTLVTPILADAIQNQPYSQSLLIGGTPPPSAVTVSGLPLGVVATHNGSGSLILAGTPTSAGTYNLTIIASNSVGSVNLIAKLTVGVNDARVALAAGQVSAGASQACAVVNGGLQCWSYNYAHRATPSHVIAAGSGVTAVASGAGSYPYEFCAIVSGGLQCSVSPGETRVQTIAVDSGVTAIAKGVGYTCVVVMGGLQCWGRNACGQIGDAKLADRVNPVQTIASGSGVTAVAIGSDHTCALINGGVQCWGLNRYGQLGDGSTTDRNTPVQIVTPGSGATALVAGSMHTCAVINGSVQCWGRNDQGQLGDTTTNDRASPVQVNIAGGGASDLGAGTAHTCAVINGGLKCWGDNTSGQLGEIRPAGSGVTAVTSKAAYTCAVVNTRVQCWAFLREGKFADAAFNHRTVPVQAIATGSGTTALSSGDNDTCAVVNNGVKCWGREVVDLQPPGTFGLRSTPVQSITEGSGVVAIAVSGQRCALIDGGVRCYQGIEFTQIIPSGSGVNAVVAGNYHACAVANFGVQCWGNNSLGQLGDGSRAQRFAPVQTVAVGSGVIALAARNNHSCAVINGGVQCWGYNDNGQIGDGTTITRLTPFQTIPAGSGATLIAAGFSDACANVASGIHCWGSGFGTRPSEIMAAAGDTTALAMGLGHFCAVRGGGLHCWGGNNVGQLGDGRYRSYETHFQTIAANSGVTAVTTGALHTCAIVNGGTVCFGEGSYGQLGIDITAKNGEVRLLEPPLTTDQAVNRYRIYIPSTGGHLFTTNKYEYDLLTANAATYIPEGVDHKIFSSPVTSNGVTVTPYYRLYIRPIRQHLWTSDTNEYNVLRAQTSAFVDEGIDGYLYLNVGIVGTVPLYRPVLNNTPIHHWTIDKNEFDTLVRSGSWTPEGRPENPAGVTGYVMQK